MVTVIALIVDGKYKLQLEGVYLLTFCLDLVFILNNTNMFS